MRPWFTALIEDWETFVAVEILFDFKMIIYLYHII